jgi:translation initiation factor IF-2
VRGGGRPRRGGYGAQPLIAADAGALAWDRPGVARAWRRRWWGHGGCGGPRAPGSAAVAGARPGWSSGRARPPAERGPGPGGAGAPPDAAAAPSAWAARPRRAPVGRGSSGVQARRAPGFAPRADSRERRPASGVGPGQPRRAPARAGGAPGAPGDGPGPRGAPAWPAQSPTGRAAGRPGRPGSRRPRRQRRAASAR